MIIPFSLLSKTVFKNAKKEVNLTFRGTKYEITYLLEFIIVFSIAYI